MKYFLLVIALFSLSAKAQARLDFNKKLIESEDKWVAQPTNKDSTYTYGYIYLDNIAGLTFHLEGSFKIIDNKFINVNKQTIMNRHIQRLTPTNVKVAIIPNERFKEIDVAEFPDWLKSYKRANPNDVDRLFRLGFVHNEWHECAKALVYLEKVKAINPKYDGLNAEFAFAYNALKQYDKAIEILADAIKDNPNNCYLYKELIYAQMNLRQVDKAVSTCKQGRANCNNNALKGEMAYNITALYFNLKDKEQFKLWTEETKKWLLAGMYI